MKKESMLVVEDEDIMRDALVDYFSDGGHKVDTAIDGDKELKKYNLEDYDVMIIDLKLPGRNGLSVLKEVRIKNPKAKVIIITAYPSVETETEAIRGGAIDYLAKPFDLNYLEEKKINFYNVPTQSYDVAQGVIAYILAFATNLVEGDRSMKRGQWKKNSLIGSRITGKKLGIIGCGKIGREVTRLGSALGIKVIVSDPCLKDDPNVTPVTLDVLLSTSDFISVNCPLTNGTRDLIGAEEIAKMKDNIFLVNTARGGIINEKALLDALNEGKVVAALDVLVSKPPFEDDLSKKLIMNENVIVTPHSIGQTFEAIQEKGEGVIKAINDHVDSRK